eukprot:8610904-Heterocapsa_arctica.AAC.1
MWRPAGLRCLCGGGPAVGGGWLPAKTRGIQRHDRASPRASSPAAAPCRRSCRRSAGPSNWQAWRT